MRCKFCGADMRAVTYNSDGYSERLVVLDDFNKINEDSPTSTGGWRTSDKRQQCCRVIMNDIWVHNVD